MYFQQSEHNPPHFHVVYGEDFAEINIATGEIIEGYLPPKATAMIREWTDLHRSELQQIWETQIFTAIAPLE